MPDYLSDPPASWYWVLGLVAVVGGLTWFHRRQRLWLYVTLVVGALLLLLFAADRLWESPREQAVQRMKLIIAAVQQRQPDGCVQHVAEQIEYQGEHAQSVILTREQLRQAPFWQLLRHYDVRVTAWDFAREDVRRLDPDNVEIGFLAKGEAEGKQVPFYVRATFTRQPDQSWKLTRLASFDPLKRQNERRTIPGLSR
ncbi:MAG: hypothetical protein NZ703_00020 [Gemmataceae bacterium]|nr:hypothetical protein [Gemmataceae bacterium]MCS7269446.1 hypothetical protein [Gemmataceae bacterium]MDW8242324.1 hypothetical protein [Thermogemmata sp.]